MPDAAPPTGEVAALVGVQSRLATPPVLAEVRHGPGDAEHRRGGGPGLHTDQGGDLTGGRGGVRQ